MLEIVQRSRIESSLGQFSLFYKKKQKDWINFPLDLKILRLLPIVSVLPSLFHRPPGFLTLIRIQVLGNWLLEKD